MKKFALLILILLGTVTGSLAQLADFANGYYRVSNSYTNRYIQVMDNTGSLNYQATTADMAAIVLVKGLDKVISDPATVLYIEKHDQKYDIKGQTTGIYQIISTYVNIMKSRNKNFPNSYWAYGSQSGMTLYLYDAASNLDREESYLSSNGKDECRNWTITPIDNNTENFFGVAPTIEANGKYYKPFYADFPFTCASSGMKVYYITKVDEAQGQIVYKEITGTVPALTPVIIECSSTNPANNKLNIGGSAAAITDNKAKGVVFEFELYKHENFVTYDKSKMRSLAINSKGELGAVAGNYKLAPRNEFYIPVSTSAPAEFKLVHESEYVGVPVEATSVTLNKTSLSLTIGSSDALTATVAPADATNKTVTWTSANTAVATVDASGKVQAVGVGTTTITATCGKVSATCSVTVNPIMATSVTLDKNAVELLPGQTETVAATVAPDNTTNKTVTWTSSNTAVATVSAAGVITAVAPGTATVTAACGTVSATCAVTVKAVPAESITLSATQLDLKIGDRQNITATVLPGNATVKTVTWTSSNAAVASVDANGAVTALAEGTATITATCGTVSATCAVTVKAVPAESITLSATQLDLKIGDRRNITATVLPGNATVKTVTWTSSNASVASVDANGAVTALAEGTATITATCGTVTATCTVTVSPVLASAITLSQTAAVMHAGESITLYATVDPSNTTDKTLTWTSSNPAVATVDAYGKVEAIAEGTADITVTCGSVSAVCKVEVVRNVVDVTGITLSETSLQMVEGNTTTLVATVSPDNADDKTVTWTSTNEYVATVDAQGNVTAVSTGSATIVATAGSYSAFCTVEVTPAYVAVESIRLNESSIEITAEDTFTLIATVNPDNATFNTVTWTTSDETIATVDANGVVTGVAEGEAMITATADGVTATCRVKVNARGGVSDILADGDALYDVYTIQGALVIKRGESIDRLPAGLYIINGQKVYLK